MPNEHSDLLTVLYSIYPDAAALWNRHTAHMVVEGHHLMSQQAVPGVEIRTEETEDAIVLGITIAEGVHVTYPIHTCVGLMAAQGLQHIRLHVKLERGASAELLAHCMFPNAELVQHVMEANVEIGEDAELRHTEGHFHGPFGGIEVIPQANVHVGPGGRYFSDFSLTSGRVGKLQIVYKVETADNAVAEISARVFGHGGMPIGARGADERRIFLVFAIGERHVPAVGGFLGMFDTQIETDMRA